jgi:TolA-binding protein
MREDCTYFLGTAKFEQHDYKAAISWMAKSYLEKYPNGRWASGARYHLGRCAEAQHDIGTAVQYYSMTDSSPQSSGNLIRARRLQATVAGAAADHAKQ